MFNAARQMRMPERPPLRFDAIVMPPPPGWTHWGRLRVTALNHGPVPADLRRVCRKLRLGGRIVSLLEVARYDEATGQEVWPPEPVGGSHRCADIREYRIAPRADGKPGTASFDVLILPGKGLGKLGYKGHYGWADRPGDEITGLAQP